MSRADNLTIFNTSNLVRSYDPDGGLTPAEHALVNNWIAPGSKVLDLGIGTGRTYPALSSLSSQYVGIDYSAAMVQAAKARFPEGDFRVADAADMSAFESESFDAVVFSYNGIDYLHPYEQRVKAFAEMSRLLKPGGVMIFSSHNARSVFRLNFARTGSLKQTLKSIAISAYTTMRSSKHLIFSKVFWLQAGYAYDRLQPLLTYYVTPAKLVQEVKRCGFVPVQVLGGDYPRPLWSFRSPWTYVAALKPERQESDFELEVAESEQSIEIAKKEWQTLSGIEGIGVFQTWAWFEAWRSHLVPDGRLKIVIARNKKNREVVGLLPLVWQRRNAHRLIKLPLNYIGIAGAGPGGADHLGPVTTDKQVGALLLKKVVEISGGSSLYLENLSSTWAAIAGVSIAGGKTTVLTECPMNARTAKTLFEDSWSKKVQKNLRRRLKLMSEEGIRFRWVDYGEDFKQALQSLRNSHQLRLPQQLCWYQCQTSFIPLTSRFFFVPA